MTLPLASPLHRGASLVLTVDRLDHDGAGVAEVRTDAGLFRLHVAGALPGERVRARVAHVSPHGRDRVQDAWADLGEIASASPERVTPPCPVQNRCGGCPLAAWAYPAQLEWKRGLVAEAIAAQEELSRGEPAGFASGVPSREGLARPSARARAQRAGVGGKVQVPKSPKGEASGEAVAGGGRRAKRTLRGFPCQ